MAQPEWATNPDPTDGPTVGGLTAGPPTAWTAPAAGLAPGWAAPPPARRRRPGRSLLAVLAVVAMVGGGAVAVRAAVQVAAPAEVVEHYFAAVRAGDAPTALSYGDTPPGDHAFLTSAALGVQNQLAAIGSVRVDPATVTGRTARVPITYTLTPAAAPTRPSIQTTDVALHRRGRGWSLDRTAAVVRVVAVGAGRRATLAGAAIPAGPVALFPGVVPVRYDTTLIQQQLNSGYVTLTSSAPVKVGAQLSESGRSVVESAVRKAFVTCLARPIAATSRSCPLTPTTSGRPVPGSLRGSLRRSAFDVGPSLGDADGLVRTSGSFFVDGHYQTLDYNNLASTATGTVQVNFVAAVYATTPGTVRWEQP
jgi:hypothetical protein